MEDTDCPRPVLADSIGWIPSLYPVRLEHPAHQEPGALPSLTATKPASRTRESAGPDSPVCPRTAQAPQPRGDPRGAAGSDGGAGTGGAAEAAEPGRAARRLTLWWNAGEAPGDAEAGCLRRASAGPRRAEGGPRRGKRRRHAAEPRGRHLRRRPRPSAWHQIDWRASGQARAHGSCDT
jgi:hypothetical protein